MTIRSTMRAAAAGLLLAGCGGGHAPATYRPQVREVTITAVPLLVREQATSRHTYP